MPQPAGPNSRTGNSINWEVVGQILGAVAAIAGWIAVVGGARVWARLHAADIPATQTLAVLPRELLLVEGLQTLLVPLLIGGGAALFVNYSWPEMLDEKRRELKEEGRTAERDRRGTAAAKERLRSAAENDQGGPPDEGEIPGDERPFVPRDGTAEPAPLPSGGQDPKLADNEPPEVRMPAPLLLLSGLVKEHGGPRVLVVSAICGVLLVTLGLAIIRVNWLIPVIAVVLGTALAALGWRVSPVQTKTKRVLLILAALAPVGGVLIAVAVHMEWGYIIAMGVVTFAAVWLTLGALVNRSRSAVALTLFAALALWAGALGFLRDLGADDPELETAVVERKNAPTVSGFYLGGSGGDVYIAALSKPRDVTLIKKDDVASLSFGESMSVKPKEADKVGGQNAADKDTSQGGTPGGPDSRPAPTPDPALEDVVEVAPGSLDGVPVKLEVMEPQRGSGLMVLNLRLTNRSTGQDIPRRLIIDSLLDDEAAGERSDERDTLDGLSVADLDGSYRHGVAQDTEGRCLCSRHLSRVRVEPGQAVRLYATFSPPPRERRFQLQVDGFGSIPVEPHG